MDNESKMRVAIVVPEQCAACGRVSIITTKPLRGERESFCPDHAYHAVGQIIHLFPNKDEMSAIQLQAVFNMNRAQADEISPDENIPTISINDCVLYDPWTSECGRFVVDAMVIHGWRIMAPFLWAVSKQIVDHGFRAYAEIEERRNDL